MTTHSALPTDRVLVVAEIGNNHEGDVHAAMDLVRAAACAGCDAVKLQVFRADAFVRPSQPDRLAQMNGFQLADDEVEQIIALARELGLMVIATPLDMPSLTLVASQVDALKIASGDNDHLPLIQAVAAVDVPLIISTGLTDIAGIRRALEAVREVAAGREVWLLQCTAAYPAMPEEANLGAIATMAREFGLPVGYSDHTAGVEVAALAVAAGARMIEKHITLDHRRSGFRDHLISADPSELTRLVAEIRSVERIVGDGVKRPLDAETPLMTAARRSIVAAQDIPQGAMLEEADITWMRPRDGMRPGEESRLIGRTLTRTRHRGQSLLEAETE